MQIRRVRQKRINPRIERGRFAERDGPRPIGDRRAFYSRFNRGPPFVNIQPL